MDFPNGPPLVHMRSPAEATRHASDTTSNRKAAVARVRERDCAAPLSFTLGVLLERRSDHPATRRLRTTGERSSRPDTSIPRGAFSDGSLGESAPMLFHGSQIVRVRRVCFVESRGSI